MLNLDFFDDSSLWDSDPLIAFTTFVKSEEFLKLGRRVVMLLDDGETIRPMRNSAITVYIAMFSKFLRFLDGKPVSSVTCEHIVKFLSLRDTHNGKVVPTPTSLIRLRYLRLFERVYVHLKISPNPASEAIKYFRENVSVGKDASKVALTEDQLVAFMANMPQISDYTAPGGTIGWKRRRDRAMQAVMIGAGLTVAETIGLYIENVGQVDSSGSAPISISPASVDGTGRWHQSQLRPFAVQIVIDWVFERKQMNIPTNLLFPASLVHTKKLNSATVYRQVNATFERAGIKAYRQGGRTLRNTFAARELKSKNASLELVGEFLGHRKLKSTKKYIPKK